MRHQLPLADPLRMPRRHLHPMFALSLLVAATACASGGGPRPVEENVQAVRALPPETTPPPAADGMPTGFGAAFNAADARARAVVYYQQCYATVLRLRASGAFGATASAPRAVYCERTAEGLPIGGVYDIDSAFTRARRLTLIRLDGSRPKYTDAVDTVRLVREAHLVRDVTRDITAAIRRQGRYTTVVPITQASGVTEAWVIPLSSGGARTTVLGGDIGIVRDAAGALTRTVDRSATWKVVPVPAAGIVQFASAEREVPAVADLAVARALAERGRDVTVRTSVSVNTLVRGFDPASGSRFTWDHTRATP